MNTTSSNLLRLPSGSAALFLQAARNQQLMVQGLNDLYDSWAYLPVHTPLVDFSRSYEGLVPEKDLQRVYHLVDRDGEILMLRWDLTLFLVKQVRNLLGEAPLPLRLCYADSIVRHQDSDDIDHNEFFQTGAELIGASGPEGDLEVLLLLHAALRKLGLAAAVHLGSRALFNRAFGESAGAELARAIAFRDFAAARRLAAGPSADACLDLFALIGRPAEIRAAAAGLAARLPADLGRDLEALLAFAESAQALEPDLDIHIDFSELGGQSYYSGIVFKAYVDGFDSAIASGGRYDRLLERLGHAAPAAGFSIMLSKVSAAADDTKAPPLAALPAGADFASRYRQAAELRRAGKRVAL